MADTSFYATGKRKTAVARVWLKPGNGRIMINQKEAGEYFDAGGFSVAVLEKPFSVTETKAKFDVLATIKGGGKVAQAEALRHGISRALTLADQELRGPLKKAGFLTRDARVKERKKYGLKSARARFQFSKR